MDYLKLFRDHAAKPIKKSYRDFENFYKANSMDVEDVNQEVKIALWKLVSKNEKLLTKLEKEELQELTTVADVKKRKLPLTRYIGKFVGNHLKDFIMQSVKVEVDKDDINIFSDYSDKSPEQIIDDLNISELESRILYKKYVEHKSYSQIAKEEGLKKRRVDYLLIMLVKNHAKKANKTHYINSSRLNNSYNQDDSSNEMDIFTDNANKDQLKDITTDFAIPEHLFEEIKPLLTEQEYNVIYLKFELSMSDREIAKLINLTAMRVGQLCRQAITKLRKNLKKDFTF